MRKAQWVDHEGSIRRPTAPQATAPPRSYICAELLQRRDVTHLLEDAEFGLVHVSGGELTVSCPLSRCVEHGQRLQGARVSGTREAITTVNNNNNNNNNNIDDDDGDNNFYH